MLAQRARVALHVVSPRPSYWRSKSCIRIPASRPTSNAIYDAQLFSIPFREYERQLPQQFADMFSGSGFNPKTDIAGIISQSMGTRVLNSATRTFLWQNGRPALGDHLLREAPFGRIAFANTDLSGVADHRASITEAKCGRTVARSGSELNLFVFIVLVFFDLDP